MNEPTTLGKGPQPYPPLEMLSQWERERIEYLKGKPIEIVVIVKVPGEGDRQIKCTTQDRDYEPTEIPGADPIPGFDLRELFVRSAVKCMAHLLADLTKP